MLLILAGVSINLVLGPNGLITRAQEAVIKTEDASNEEQEKLLGTTNYIDELVYGERLPVISIAEAKKKEEGFAEKTIVEDIQGNKIIVPEGFKIAGGENGSGDSVQQGIVIEDAFSEDENVRGSQYVWIPVGKFRKDNGELSNEIVLGRYGFKGDRNAKSDSSSVHK